MDKEFEININDKKAVKYLKILIITLLAVIEIIVCAQYIEIGRASCRERVSA